MQISVVVLKRISILFLTVCSSLVFSQDGTTIYPFLNIPTSARQSALGGNVISMRDYDVSSTAFNPSLMNIEMDNMVSVNYASYLADSKIGSLNYVKDLSKGHLISINARYMDYGQMPRTDENANILGNFSAMDASVGAGYAYQLEEDWTIGANVNLITSKIDTYSSAAISGNLGVTYHNEENNETLSVVARNLGYQFQTYNGVRENLPFSLDLGYTKILDQFPAAISVTLHDLQKFDISQEKNINEQPISSGRKVLDHLSLGLELFPQQSFNLRLGYNVKRGNEMAVLDQRNFSGLSFGFGVKISYFKFDYSHARYHNSSNVNMFGLSLDLIELSGNRR